MTTTIDAPVPDKERQRRHRARKRCGLVLARAEVPDRIVEALVEQGVLPEAQATDARPSQNYFFPESRPGPNPVCTTGPR